MNSLTRRRRALMMANMLDITKLIFSYTGNYTDELMTIGGVEYRVEYYQKRNCMVYSAIL